MSQIERPKELSSLDVFNDLIRFAQHVDLGRAQRDQKDEGRVAFIRALVENLRIYDLEPSRVRSLSGTRDEVYYRTLQEILHSLTTEVIGLIRACQENNFETFANISKKLDFETLRRLDRLPKERLVETPLSLQGRRPVDIFTQLAASGTAAIDVRTAAVRKRWADQGGFQEAA